jgi:tRNA G10  N-methylase Trm11
MAQDKNDTYRTDEKETIDTGSNLPHGDGTVSDEDIKKIDGGSGKPTGQDHSLEDYEKTMPTDGVGAVQNQSDTTSDIAHI